LVLSGLSLQGRFHRCIELSDVLQVDVKNDNGLLIWLSGGEVIRISIAQPETWKMAIEGFSGTPKT
jgi:hypothetical protein